MKSAYAKGYKACVRGKGGISDCPYEFGKDKRERQWASGYIDAMLDAHFGRRRRRWK